MRFGACPRVRTWRTLIIWYNALMKNKTKTNDTLVARAAALAEVVTDYAHFGEMAQALRAAQRALKAGELELPEGTGTAQDKMRLRDGGVVVALARELWIEARA